MKKFTLLIAVVFALAIAACTPRSEIRAATAHAISVTSFDAAVAPTAPVIANFDVQLLQAVYHPAEVDIGDSILTARVEQTGVAGYFTPEYAEISPPIDRFTGTSTINLARSAPVNGFKGLGGNHFAPVSCHLSSFEAADRNRRLFRAPDI